MRFQKIAGTSQIIARSSAWNTCNNHKHSMNQSIDIVLLFPLVNRQLIALLRSLTPEDWKKPTICSQWKVGDIAAHLLDVTLRKLSAGRDRHTWTNPSISSYEELVSYLNTLNAEWVTATRRLSPRVLTDLLDTACEQFYSYIGTLDPEAPALYPVAWAGEAASTNRFDIARDYTEYWLHQQQIRLATDNPGLMSRELYYPVLDIFMQALPHTYRTIEAAEQTVVQITVSGEVGGTWFLLRSDNRWELVNNPPTTPVSIVVLDPDIAWRLFSRGISSQAAQPFITVQGDRALGMHICSMVSVMA